MQEQIRDRVNDLYYRSQKVAKFVITNVALAAVIVVAVQYSKEIKVFADTARLTTISYLTTDAELQAQVKLKAEHQAMSTKLVELTNKVAGLEADKAALQHKLDNALIPQESLKEYLRQRFGEKSAEPAKSGYNDSPSWVDKMRTTWNSMWGNSVQGK